MVGFVCAGVIIGRIHGVCPYQLKRRKVLDILPAARAGLVLSGDSASYNKLPLRLTDPAQSRPLGSSLFHAEARSTSHILHLVKSDLLRVIALVALTEFRNRINTSIEGVLELAFTQMQNNLVRFIHIYLCLINLFLNRCVILLAKPQ